MKQTILSQAGSRLCAQPPTRGRNAALEMAGPALYPPRRQVHRTRREAVAAAVAVLQFDVFPLV